MKILLINPSLHQATTGQYKKDIEKKRGLYPPLGLAYVAAVLEKDGQHVNIFDCDAETENLDEMKKEVLKICKNFQPDVVGFYAMTWTYQQTKILADLIKNWNKQTITIIGGPNVSCLPRESVELGQFDFGVRGEGEATVIELIHKIEGKINKTYEEIDGLIFKKNNEIIINSARELITDLDSIPFPARHLLPIEKYFDVFSREKKIATLIATRGCPFNCIFCDRENRMGRNWRVRTPENIVQEIKQIKEEYGIKEFMFFDDNLIVDKKWGLELCEKLKPLKIIWECRNRVDLVDEEMLQAMKDAGCYRIRFGFESGDNEILKILKKDIQIEDSLRVAKLCKKIGIEIFGYFMMGVPYETEEQVKKTIDLSFKINPGFAVYSKAILIPGSEMFGYGLKMNQISANYWKKYLTGEETDGAPTFDTQILPEKKVDELVSQAEKKFYFRVSFIISKLMSIQSFGHLMNQVKIAWALFFK